MPFLSYELYAVAAAFFDVYRGQFKRLPTSKATVSNALKVEIVHITVPDGIAPISDDLVTLIQLMFLPRREVMENTTVPLQERVRLWQCPLWDL